jgi:hypothetical protein
LRSSRIGGSVKWYFGFLFHGARVIRTTLATKPKYTGFQMHVRHHGQDLCMIWELNNVVPTTCWSRYDWPAFLLLYLQHTAFLVTALLSIVHSKGKLISIPLEREIIYPRCFLRVLHLCFLLELPLRQANNCPNTNQLAMSMGGHPTRHCFHNSLH